MLAEFRHGPWQLTPKVVAVFVAVHLHGLSEDVHGSSLDLSSAILHSKRPKNGHSEAQRPHPVPAILHDSFSKLCRDYEILSCVSRSPSGGASALI
jgi:hypothetical protein